MGTDNQNSQEGTFNEAEKTFTQSEVDTIVKERLRRDREKYADYDALKEKAAKFDEYEAANKTELEKMTEKAKTLQAELDGIKKASALREMREKIATDNNVPIEFLTGTTEEECTAQADKVKEMFSVSGIPVRVTDGGEVLSTGAPNSGALFEKWAKDKL